MRNSIVAALVVLLSCSQENNLEAKAKIQVVGEPAYLANPVHTDRIAQIQPPQADVLWMIDNSCSMSCIVGCHTGGSVTDLVTENFSSFMQHFEGSGVDYHIGVITSDMKANAESGKLQSGGGLPWIEPNTPNPELVFTAMAVNGTGTDGSDEEHGLGAIYTAIEVLGDANNNGFFRDQADLHTIVLSNEDDQSTEITPDEFTDWYDALRPTATVAFHSLVCTDANTPECTSIGRPGRFGGANYLGVTTAIGGFSHDITDPNWTGVLNALGAQAAGLSSEFFLSDLPAPGTIEVTLTQPNGGSTTVDEVDIDSEEPGFTYRPDRNSVLFLQLIPDPGATVSISYELAAHQYNSNAEEPE